MRIIDADALIEKWYEVNNIGPEDRGARFIGYTEIPRFINNAPTVQPTGDLISRADAVKAIRKCKFESVMPSDWYRGTECAQDIVEELPSAELPKGELISRADAIEAACNEMDWLDDGCVEERKTMIKDALSALPSAEAEWIPVKTRPMDEEERREWSEKLGYDIEYDEAVIYTSQLPDDGQAVLTCNRYGNITIDIFENDPDYGCGFEENGDMDGIVAWMPLPKPYREDGE